MGNAYRMMVVGWATVSMPTSADRRAARREGNVRWGSESAVFLADCNGTIANNLTYIVSPSFPSFMPSNFTECKLKVKIISDDISQLRLDFHHFSLGQPNRRTGVCDGDVFNISGGPRGSFLLCGQNSGQHCE